MEFTIMRWIMFIAGLTAFGVGTWKKRTAPQTFALLLFSSLLIIVALFAPFITSFEFGKSGVKITLKDATDAAKFLVLKTPQIAEAITGQKGNLATKEAIEKIDNVKTPEQLNQIIPFTLQGDSILFSPKINSDHSVYYRVENLASPEDVRIQKYTLESSSKYPET